MGLVVVDISDPTEPRILSQFSHPTWFGVHNLFLYEERAYLAHAANRGLTEVDLADPANPAVSGFWTNERRGFSNVIHDVFIRDGLAFLSDIIEDRGGWWCWTWPLPTSPLHCRLCPLQKVRTMLGKTGVMSTLTRNLAVGRKRCTLSILRRWRVGLRS